MIDAPKTLLRQIEVTAAPPRITRIATSFTTRCNLRCTYCPEGSHPEEFYGDMTREQLQRLIDYAKEKGGYLDISFYGDSTFHKDFGEFAAAIIDAGVPLKITSNLARLLSDDEIATISRCMAVSFSFDTPDRDLAKDIRKGLDLRTLVFNVLRVRAYCLEAQIDVPPFTLHAVLSDRVVHDLPRLVAFAASMGVYALGCNELAEMEGARSGLRNIAELRGPELQAAIEKINEATALGKRLGVAVTLSEQQVARVNAAATGKLQENRPREAREGIQGTYYFEGEDAVELAPGMTRFCTEPWMAPFVDPKGDVYPCCTRGTTMGIVDAETSLGDVHNNENFRRLRRALVTGENLDTECRLCHVAGAATPEALQRKVAALFV